MARKVDCELVTPNDCKQLCNAIEVSDLKGGLWIPGDGVANPYEICLALSHLGTIHILNTYYGSTCLALKFDLTLPNFSKKQEGFFKTKEFLFPH